MTIPKDLLGCWWGLCQTKKYVDFPAAANLTPKIEKQLPRKIHIWTGRPPHRATLPLTKPGDEQCCDAPGDSCSTSNWTCARTELITDHRQPCGQSNRTTVAWPAKMAIIRTTKMVARWGGGLDGAHKTTTMHAAAWEPHPHDHMATTEPETSVSLALTHFLSSFLISFFLPFTPCGLTGMTGNTDSHTVLLPPLQQLLLAPSTQEHFPETPSCPGLGILILLPMLSSDYSLCPWCGGWGGGRRSERKILKASMQMSYLLKAVC